MVELIHSWLNQQNFCFQNSYLTKTTLQNKKRRNRHFLNNNNNNNNNNDN